MKTFVRIGSYQDTGEAVSVMETQEEISVGNGQTIPGLKSLHLDGRALTAAGDEKLLFKDLFTGRLIKLKDES